MEQEPWERDGIGVSDPVAAYVFIRVCRPRSAPHEGICAGYLLAAKGSDARPRRYALVGERCTATGKTPLAAARRELADVGLRGTRERLSYVQARRQEGSAQAWDVLFAADISLRRARRVLAEELKKKHRPLGLLSADLFYRAAKDERFPRGQFDWLASTALILPFGRA